MEGASRFIIGRASLFSVDVNLAETSPEVNSIYIPDPDSGRAEEAIVFNYRELGVISRLSDRVIWLMLIRLTLFREVEVVVLNRANISFIITSIVVGNM